MMMMDERNKAACDMLVMCAPNTCSKCNSTLSVRSNDDDDDNENGDEMNNETVAGMAWRGGLRGDRKKHMFINIHMM
jgi:hypothetical protein